MTGLMRTGPLARIAVILQVLCCRSADGHASGPLPGNGRNGPRSTFEPFGNLPFLGLRGPGAWPDAHSRARRLQAAVASSTSGRIELPPWASATHNGGHALPDGSAIVYEASARPHRRWTEIYSADLEGGVHAVSCKTMGGRRMDVVIEGTNAAMSRLVEMVRATATTGGKVLLIGSGGWQCIGGQHWYISTARIVSCDLDADADGGAAVQLSGRRHDLHEAFEELDLHFSLKPAAVQDVRNSNASERPDGQTAEGRQLFLDRLLDKTLSNSFEQSTSYGFNWDFEAGTTETDVLSLLNLKVGSSEGSSAGLSVNCVECFARAVASLEIRYSFRLTGPPRIYVALEGNAELHAWLEVVASLQVDETWERVLAEFELPTIHVSIYGFPVSFTPFTRLRSKLLARGRVLGSLRGGFGARGRVHGRFEMNTAGWNELPAGAQGVKGLASGLEIDFAQRLVTPTFAFQADDADIVLRLVPVVGVRLWSSFAAELSAEGYLGAQVTDINSEFDFLRTDGDADGRLYARPVRIIGLKRNLLLDWSTFQISLAALGEEEVYRPQVPLNMASILRTGVNEYTLDFATSELAAQQHLSFESIARLSALPKLNVQATLARITNLSAPSLSPPLVGSLQGLRNKCDDVPRPEGNMLACTTVFRLNSETEKDLGDLEMLFFWTPTNMAFVPTGGRDLQFTQPQDVDNENGAGPLIWGEGECYVIAWVLDSEAASPPLKLRAAGDRGTRPLEIRPGELEIVLQNLNSGGADRSYMCVPLGFTGWMAITAEWAVRGGENREGSTTTSVLVTQRWGLPFDVTSPGSIGPTVLQLFADLPVTWRIQHGIRGEVDLILRTGDTMSVIYERRGVEVSLGDFRLSWLHIRGDSVKARELVLTVTFRDRRYPARAISVIRRLQLQISSRAAEEDSSEQGGRLLRGSVAGQPVQDMQQFSRQLAPVSLDKIRAEMFKGCSITSKYALFGGVDVSAAVRVLGPCQDGASCPDVELLGGFLRIVPPTAIDCAALFGSNWCQGELYGCSHGAYDAKYQPVISLKLSKQVDPLPSSKQLEYLQKRIATGLSLLPDDITLADISALSERAELIFRLAKDGSPTS